MRVKAGVTNYYVYRLGLLYEADDSINTKTYHYDYRGSTVALTDGSGNVMDRIEYSPYGTTTYRSGTTDTPFLFNGFYGIQSDANGLLYMRARYYNPYLCRFINPDPIGFAGGLNWYAYVGNNPVDYVDPLGLLTAVVVGGPGPANQNNPSGSPNFFGHVSIATTGNGVYSFGTRPEDLGGSFTDYLKWQATYRDSTVYVLNTNPDQEKAINDYLESQKENPIELYPDNCANRVINALGAGGIVLTQPSLVAPIGMPIAERISNFPDAIGSALGAMGPLTIRVPKGSTLPPNFLIGFNPLK